MYFVNGIKCICTNIYPDGDVEMTDYNNPNQVMFSHLSPKHQTLRPFKEEQPNE